jgi:hypothetical protein
MEIRIMGVLFLSKMQCGARSWLILLQTFPTYFDLFEKLAVVFNDGFSAATHTPFFTRFLILNSAGRGNRRGARLRDATPVQAEVAEGARSRDDETSWSFLTAN